MRRAPSCRPALPAALALAARRAAAGGVLRCACAHSGPCARPAHFSVAVAGVSPRGSVTVRFQLNRGSNPNILSAGAASEICRHSQGVGCISGIWAALSYTSVATDSVNLGAGAAEDVFVLSFLYTPRGKKNILSESHLLDNFGIKVDKLPPRVIFADGSFVPAQHVNGVKANWPH